MLNPSIKQLYGIILILKDSCTVRRFAGKLPHPNIIFCSEVEHCCWSEGFCFTHEKESIEMVPTRLGSTAEQCKLNNVESKCGLRPGERHRPCQQETWLCRKYVSCEAARQWTSWKKMNVIFPSSFSSDLVFCVLVSKTPVNFVFTCPLHCLTLAYSRKIPEVCDGR